MKKRIFALMLCVLTVFTSLPMTTVGQLYSVEAQAVSIEELRSVFQSVPARDTWSDYIDTELLAAYYGQAEIILSSPDGVSQEKVDSCTEGLRSAVAALKMHTKDIEIFDRGDISIDVGKSKNIRAILVPVDAGDAVEWSLSCDSSVATIEKTAELNAKITVKKYIAGGFTVTAASNGFTDSRKVNVVNVLSSVKLNLAENRLFEGQSFTLKAQAVGADPEADVSGEQIAPAWSSSNPDVATVSDSGVVTAVSSGSAVISAEMQDVYGNVASAKCTVTVNEAVKVTSLVPQTVSTSGVITRSIGDPFTFKITVLPKNATVKDLTWTTENKNIATVTDIKVDDTTASALITPVASGKVKISYSTTDGSGLGGYFYVSVRPFADSVKFTESFKVISPNSTGEKLSAKVLPEDADNTLVWQSSNPNVCQVDAYGELYPKAVGVVTITAVAKDGSGKADSMTLRIAEGTEYVTINKREVSLDSGDTLALTATVKSGDGSEYRNVKWSTSNSKVVKVTDDGKITAVGPGEAVIKATAYDTANKFALCVVTVRQPLLGISLPSTAVVEIGGTKTIKPTFNPTTATNKNVTWKSSNTSIATVSSSGVVTGKKVGKVTITCTSEEGGYKDTCTVSVEIPADGVSLNKSSVSLMSGKTYQLKATVTPSSASNKSVTWTSSNTKIATVSSTGLVKAVAGGSCTITAKTASGGHVAKCTVKVTQTTSGVELNYSTLSLYTTGTKTLKATVLPETATNKAVTWSSDNTSVATVTSSGKVTGVRVGTANITVTTQDGGQKAVCVVKVYKKIDVTGLTIDSTRLNMTKGDSTTILATVSPSNASEKGLTWTSTDSSVVSVSSTGVVKALKTGTVVITVTTKDGGFQRQCKVSVTQPVTGVRITESDVRLPLGKSKTLKANIFPSDASNKKLTWISSNESVATVSKSGVVTAHKSGTTVISVITDDGGYSSSSNFTVFVAVSSIKLNATKLKLPKGEKRILTATIEPSNAENKEIIWSTSNNSVASVNEVGQVTAKKKGTAKITAASADGNFVTSCVVEVVQLATSVTLDYTKLTIDAGKTKTIKAVLKPTTASDTTIKWKTSNKKVATVSSKGVVKAISAGNVTITAYSADGNAKAYCTVTVRQPTTSISVSPKSMYVKLGAIKAITATVKPANATNSKVVWISSDTSVATVDSSGIVKGIKVGKVTITARTADGNFTAKTTVTVIKAVKSVKLNKTNIRINVGKTSTITPTISPASATIKTVKWTSSNNDVATVDSKGRVTAKGPGYAKITCTTKEGSKKAYCEVLVIQPVTSLKLNKSSLTLEAGKTYTFKPTIKPANASNKNLKWYSSDKKIATVTSKGVVKGLKSGTVKITAKTSDGKLKAVCNVTVRKSVKSVSLNYTTAKLYLNKTLTLKAKLNPVDATNQGLKWYSSDTSVATVSSKGKLTPKKPGKVIITVKTDDGGFKAKCTVYVKRAVTSIKLNKTELTLNAGKTYTLKATLAPSNATDKTVTWTTSNKKVATVTSKGVVTAVDRGTATITAKTENGLKATFNLTVYQPVKGITIARTSADAYLGEKLTIKAATVPANANKNTLTWASSDTNVLTVSSKGVITPKSTGSAVVTVKTDEGGFSAKCIVTVKRHVTSITLDKNDLILVRGKEADLKITVSPANATEKGYTVTSSNPDVVTVDEKGHLVSKELGNAVITVKSKENNKTASCKVTVVTPVSGIEISENAKTMFVGEDFGLVPTVFPSDAYYQDVIWTSSDEAVAEVSAEGKVTARKSGTAVITATTFDGGFTAKCEITSLQKATGIELSHDKLIVKRDDTVTLSAKVVPDDCYEKGFTWAIDNTDIATIDEAGNVKGIMAGTAVVTVTSADGGFTASCEVTVIEPATGLVIDQTEFELYKGYSKKINATVFPVNASDKKVNWTSSDETVATVDGNGVVTVVGKGTAIITAALNYNGEITQVCIVKGLLLVEEIISEKNEYVVYEGETVSINARALPEGAENPNILYSSNDEAVATVNGNGVIYGKSKGDAKITLTAEENASITKVITVKVLRRVTGVALDKTEHTVLKGEKFSLTATVAPESADDKSVVWVSSDEKVATVEKGVVTAVGGGEAVITVTTVDSGKSAKCKVKVIQLAEDIVFSEEVYSVEVGSKVDVIATVLPENTDDKSLTWRSLNEDIATVDEKGRVTGVSLGEATIEATAVSGDVVKTVTLRVIKFIDIINITFGKEFLWVGESASLLAEVLPENATDKNIVFGSLNPEVAVVDEKGNITAVSAGKTEIIVKALCGSAEAKLEIEVRQQPESIVLDASEKLLNTGEDFTLKATVLPENTYDKAVKWTTDNAAVASVDESGKVTGIGPGTAVITATASDGRLVASCTVKVSRYIDSISFTENDIRMEKGSEKQLTVTFAPENATETALRWESSDESILTVDESGKVRALKSGKAIVKVFTLKGDVFAECEITVFVKAQSITLSEKEKTVYYGESFELTAVVLPEDTTDSAVIWSSSNEGVARVDEKGKVTAKGAGTAVITAETKDGGFKAECSVTVLRRVEGIEIAESFVKVYLGKTYTVNAKVLPVDASNKKLIWETADEKVAIVENGVVTPVGKGDTVITATTEDGGYSAFVFVSVLRGIERISLDISSKTVEKKESFKLTPVIGPEDADDKTLVWTSSDEEIAKVVDGVVTAGEKSGKATIKVMSAADPSVYALCDVTVKEPVTALGLSKDSVELKAGESETLEVLVLPVNATNKNVIWESSDEGVALVEGGKITAVAEGTAVITVRSLDSGVSAKCTVTVIKAQ